MTSATLDGVLTDSYLVIHYHRKDRDWNDWGVHAWGNAFESTTSWTQSMFPRRGDGFGAIYVIKLNPSLATNPTPEAYFIFHKGDEKAYCGNDIEWNSKKGREMYIVEGDCREYYSLQDAMKSTRFR